MSTNAYPEPSRTRTEKPRAGARPTKPRTDPWQAEDEDYSPSANAPRTFDPFCTRRLRGCIDEANAYQ